MPYYLEIQENADQERLSPSWDIFYESGVQFKEGA